MMKLIHPRSQDGHVGHVIRVQSQTCVRVKEKRTD